MIYKCILQYNGSEYSGWQKQPGQITIQQVLEEALSIIHKSPVEVHGSGRTDKGVHAYGQVFHFESELNMDGQAFLRALNALVPKSLKILSVEDSEGFHARFDALSKTYIYRINTGERSVFDEDYVYQFNRSLDLDSMIECAKLFIGSHDFTSFNATELTIIPNQIRKIEKVDIVRQGDILQITLKADGFLRYMVRMLVAALVEVGQGRLSIDDIQTILDAKDKDAFTKNVPSCGLYLLSVDY